METKHVYPVSPWRSRIMYGLCAVIILPLFLGGLATGESALLGSAALVAAIMIPISLWAIRMARLTLTPEGIELRQAGATLRTPWHNVDAISLTRGAEGFILKTPMEGRGAERFATTSQVAIRGAHMYDPARRHLLAEQRFIPIEAFAYWIHQGSLRDVLRTYAPDTLRQAEAAAAETPPKTGGLSTAAIIALSVTITLAIGAGVLAGMRSEVEPILFRVLEGVVALALVPLAVANVASAVALVRRGRFGSGLLWGSLSIVQVLLSASLLARAAGYGN